MRLPLINLLQRHPIVHPTQIVSGNFAAGDLVLLVEGYPWWRGAQFGQTARLLISFEAVSRGRLDPRDFGRSWDDEALEELEVQKAADVDWLQPDSYQVFCSAPLPDPLSLYARVHDVLVAADSFRQVGEFLNCGESLKAFTSITSTASYNVARGPSVVRDTVCAELERQAVPHNVLSSDLGTESGLLVRLGDSQFVCAQAWAECL